MVLLPTNVAPDDSRPWPGRAILHVDLDAFFAAVEQLDHPEWRDMPVIVGGDPDGRGVVSTASYEARRFGVHSAMPSKRASLLCPNAIWAPARFERYHEISEAVFEIFRRATPRVQPVSIDEAFLDVTPGEFTTEHPVALAIAIRAEIAKLGVTASGGLASSKTVAKVASDFDKPDSLTVVWPGTEAEFLQPLPTRSLSGVGPKTADRLDALGIHSLGQLAALDPVTARDVLGARGEIVVARAAGIDDLSVRENDPAKSVSNERTFTVDVRTLEEVYGALDRLGAKVAARLRRQSLCGRTVTVKLRFADFSTRTVRRTLETTTDDEAVFVPLARELVREAWSPGIGLRLLGIGVSGFDSATRQLDLLSGSTDSSDARRELVKGLDAVRLRFGADAVRFGRELKRDSDVSSSEPPPHEPNGVG